MQNGQKWSSGKIQGSFGCTHKNDETFSPVVRFESIRTVLALAAERKWRVHQMDVTTAFLNGELHDTVYMKQREGYITPGQEQKVCRLKRSIYGLKQSHRW